MIWQILIGSTCWILFRILMGILEGKIWHLEKHTPKIQVMDSHSTLILLDVIGFILLTIAVNDTGDIINLIAYPSWKDAWDIMDLPTGLLLTSPFIHDGTMYQTRKIISYGDDYKAGFWSEPGKNSTAKINFSLRQRTLCMMIGITIIMWTS